MQWKVKEIEDAAQKGNNLEASWGPGEVSPVLPPTSKWACSWPHSQVN